MWDNFYPSKMFQAIYTHTNHIKNYVLVKRNECIKDKFVDFLLLYPKQILKLVKK